jgi:hypothetical protein
MRTARDVLQASKWLCILLQRGWQTEYNRRWSRVRCTTQYRRGRLPVLMLIPHHAVPYFQIKLKELKGHFMFVIFQSTAFGKLVLFPSSGIKIKYGILFYSVPYNPWCQTLYKGAQRGKISVTEEVSTAICYKEDRNCRKQWSNLSLYTVVSQILRFST